MFYTVYKVTNKVNNKTYIGKHQTKDLNDGYMGSGKLLKQAIIKYGIKNFNKEILHIFPTELEMNLKEKELVKIDKNSYNLCEGGKGGFGYINKTGKNIRLKQTEKQKETARNWLKENRHKINYYTEKRRKSSARAFLGKTHSVEWKEKHSEFMKENQKGSKNSQYGTCWITNGQENKKIKKEQLDLWLEKGYNKGRIYAIVA